MASVGVFEDVVLREIPSNLVVEDVVFGSPELMIGDGKIIHWDRNQTLKLIDAYKSVKVHMSGHVLTKKKMWLLIAQVMEIPPNQCENRWKVLERNYKAYIDNKRSTGRGRKNFEFCDEMHAVLGKKKTMNPSLLLDSNTVTSLESTESGSTGSGLVDPETSPTFAQEVRTISSVDNRETPVFRRRQTKARYNVLEEMRKDKKMYQEQMLEIQKAKLAALQERNRILEKKELCCCARK